MPNCSIILLLDVMHKYSEIYIVIFFLYLGKNGDSITYLHEKGGELGSKANGGEGNEMPGVGMVGTPGSIVGVVGGVRVNGGVPVEGGVRVNGGVPVEGGVST